MSYCSIITFEDGKAHAALDFSNSWGGAAYIWNALFERYLKDPERPYDNWLSRGMQDRSLWDLADREDLEIFERSVHVSTFDLAIVRRENFRRYADDLLLFLERYPVPGKSVCHLPQWAKRIREFDEKPEIEAVGFHHTSVTQSPWFQFDENDEILPYDLNERDDHQEIYDRLAQMNGG